MANEKDEGSVHKGHRQRVKQTIKEHGLDTFNEHQIFEALLFYSVANGDTNPAAHRLIDTFGSFQGVLNADYDDLCAVSGIGDNSATLITLVRMMISRYMMESCYDKKSRRFQSTEILRQYFEGFFIGRKSEVLYAVALDDELRLIRQAVLCEGTSGRVTITPRMIVDFVVKCNCNSVAIAHNHPNGICLPSKDDIDRTTELCDVLRSLDVELVDHVIVGKDGALSLRTSQHAASIWGVPEHWQ